MVLMRRSLEGPAVALASSMAVLLALVQPSVAHALIEFRPDHVSLLLIFLGLASGDRRKWFLHGLFMTLGVLINPKLFLLPLLSGGLFFIVVVRQDATAGRRWLAQTAAGILAGTGFLALVGAAMKINIQAFVMQVFQYHRIVAGYFNGQNTLAEELLTQARAARGLPFVFFILSAAGAVLHVKKKKWGFSVPVLTLFLFFVLQPALVKLPFRQYQYTLYLAAAAPVALLIRHQLQFRRAAAVSLWGILFIAGLFQQTQSVRALTAAFPVNKQIESGNFLLSLCPADYPVAAQMPYHPVFRRDAVFAWCETAIPNGFSTADIAQRFPTLAERFSYTAITWELSQRPPALVVLPLQTVNSPFGAAVRDFTEKTHPQAYQHLFTARLELYQRVLTADAQPSK
jgi:hypothetical protein